LKTLAPASLFTFHAEGPSLGTLAAGVAAVNLFLALFNMIPAFPMDGGRVLRALLANRLGFLRATEIAAFIGQGVAFALGFIGLFYNPMLIFIAIFVYLAAAAEAHMVAMRAMSPERPSRTGMPSETPPACMRCLIGLVSLSAADMVLLQI